MSRAVAVEDFSARNEIAIPGRLLRYRMTERDGKYWVRQFLLDPSGREIAADEREILWVVGSNHHSRAYVTALKGRLFQIPVCWYPEASVWDLCPGYEHKNDHFSREIRESCVFCHNARMERSGGVFREPIPEGIDCERCHGPGALHVQKWSRPGARRTGGTDPTIVNPRRLPADLRIQVCFQCHLGDSIATQRTPLLDGTPERYRPGQPIGEAFVPYHFAQALEGSFGISAQADRFILSRCYRESAGAFDCLTCHNPHITVYAPDRAPDYFRQKCLSCHEARACRADGEARAATSPPDDCVACHMRRGEPDDHPHTSFRDHWIRARIEPPPGETRTSAALVPTVPGLLDRFSPAERAYYLGRASYLTAADVPALRRELWTEAERQLRRATELGLDRVEPWLYRGKALAFLGRHEEAIAAVEQATLRDPHNREANFTLGQLLAGRGRAIEAERIFHRLVAENPDDASALAELGRLEMARGNAVQAVKRFQRAAELEPWQARLHHNLAMALAAAGRFEEASEAARTAVRLDPDDPLLWKAAAECFARAGRAREANEANEIALALAVRTKPRAKEGETASMGNAP